MTYDHLFQYASPVALTMFGMMGVSLMSKGKALIIESYSIATTNVQQTVSLFLEGIVPALVLFLGGVAIVVAVIGRL